ncbi:MAG: DUF167 domain-containing protein [Planctomycetota bacterium]
MALITESPDGAVIAVKIVARSSRERVAGIMGDRLKVCVTAPPERGKANAEVVRTVAEHFGIAASRVRIVSGETNPLKQVLLEGVSPGEAEEKIHGTA